MTSVSPPLAPVPVLSQAVTEAGPGVFAANVTVCSYGIIECTSHGCSGLIAVVGSIIIRVDDDNDGNHHPTDSWRPTDSHLHSKYYDRSHRSQPALVVVVVVQRNRLVTHCIDRHSNRVHLESHHRIP
jgi:hypothetical protein